MAAPLTMYDPQTGAPVQVDAARAGALFREGKATFAADQDVPVIGADGKIRTIKGADAGAFFTSAEGLAGGAASEGALRNQKLQEEFGGVGGQLGAALEGAARGASLGLSDAILTETGLVDARSLRGRQEANPLAAIGGEGLGLLGAVAASGGAAGAGRGVVGGAARVVTAPTRAVMALGRGVEGAGTAILGEGVVARAATAAAQGAVEGSLFGVGQAVSESSIKDVPLTAERILAAAGHGALLGGGLGGGVSVLGSVVRGAASKAGEVGAGLLGREAQLAGELAASVPRGEGTVMALVDRYGREQAIKATGATQAMVERLQTMAPEMEQRIVTRFLDALPEALGKRPGSLLNAAEKAAGAERLVQKDGERMAGLLDELSTSGAKSETTKIISEFRQKVAAETASAISPDAQRAAREMNEWLTSAEQKIAEGDVKALWKASEELRADIALGKDSGRLAGWKNGLHKAMVDEIEVTGQRAAADAIGPEFAARWKNAAADYQASNWLAEATREGKRAASSASPISDALSDIGFVGNLAAGGLGGLPTAVGGALLQNLIKRYGSDVAANVARAVTKGEGVHAIDQAIERLAGDKIARLVGVGRGAVEQLPQATTPTALAVEKAVKGRSDEPTGTIAQRFQATKQALIDQAPARAAQAQKLAVELDQVAPGLGQATADRVQAAQEFLLSKLPQRPERPSLQPSKERQREPSFDEQQKFLRYARAVDDPLSVLDDARRGKLRPEAVEALKAVYPTIYEGLRAQVHEAVAAKGDRLSYSERVRLGRLLDLPTDPSMEPAASRAYQRIQRQVPPPNRPVNPNAPPPPRPSPVALRVPSLATRTDSIGA